MTIVAPRAIPTPVRSQARQPGTLPRRPGFTMQRGGAAGPPLVVLADAGALAVAGAVTGATWWAAGGYVLSALLVLSSTGRHRLRITLRLGDELPGLLGATLAPILLLVPSADGRALLAIPAAALTVTGGRAATYSVLRAARRRGRLAEPTLLLGAGRLGCDIAEALAAHPEFGLKPRGFVDSRPPARPVPPPWLGTVPELPHVLAAHRIRRVIVCFPESPDEALVEVLRALRHAPVSVHLVPRLHELGQVGVAARDEVWGIPLAPLRRPGGPGWPGWPGWPARVAKRTADVVLAALLLAALAPLLAVLALAARAASGGPALFRQTRVTGAGRTTAIVKLRSLAPDPAGDAAADTRWAAPPERRTRLGGALRACHADELPQLVNVLRGELSLVGPRPERPYFAALFAEQIPGYAARDRMPAGMTGWAQVHGLCGDTSVRERARFDNRYVEDWSLWTDLVILVRTLARVCPRPAGRA